MPAATSHEDAEYQTATRALSTSLGSSSAHSHLEDYFIFNHHLASEPEGDQHTRLGSLPVSAGSQQRAKLFAGRQLTCDPTTTPGKSAPTSNSPRVKTNAKEEEEEDDKQTTTYQSQYLINESEPQHKQSQEQQQPQQHQAQNNKTTIATTTTKSLAKRDSFDDLELLSGARNFNYFLYEDQNAASEIEDDEDGYANIIESEADYCFDVPYLNHEQDYYSRSEEENYPFSSQQSFYQQSQQRANTMEPIMLIYADNQNPPAVIRATTSSAAAAAAAQRQSGLLARRRQQRAGYQKCTGYNNNYDSLGDSHDFGISSMTPPSQHYLSLEELKQTQNSCWLCGCNWSEDHVSLDCRECGGYALTRPCPNCDGKCKQVWRRNINATHDRHRALWTGQCQEPSLAARTSSLAFKSEPMDILGKHLVAQSLVPAPVASSCCSSHPSSASSSDSELEVDSSKRHPVAAAPQSQQQRGQPTTGASSTASPLQAPATSGASTKHLFQAKEKAAKHR